MRLLVIALLLLTGCAGSLQNAGASAATGAVDAIDTPATKKKLDDLAASAAGAARDKALDADTTKAVAALVAGAGTQVRADLVATRDALLDRKLQAELAALREQAIGAGARAEVRQLVDETLGPATQAQAAALREQLAGAPLRADFDQLLDQAGAHLGSLADTEIARARAAADAEIAKYRILAFVLAGAAVVMLVGLLLAAHTARSHRLMVKALLERGPGRTTT